MSSSSFCQGLQSCLEPRVIESRILRLKLAPPGSNPSQPSSNSKSQEQEKQLLTNNHQLDTKDNNTNSNESGCGWSFLQALSHTPHCNKTEDTENSNHIYVHPTVKRSSSMLSEKSLEMCTESLGSETGSNAGESSDENLSLFSFESSTSLHDNTVGAHVSYGSRRVNRACNTFPPPLTSMIDFGGVHVRPHREDGRLVLEAVASPSPSPVFRAERGDGRLKLQLFESTFHGCGDEEEDHDEGVDEEWNNEEEEEDHGEGVAEEWSYDDEEEDDETQNQEACGEKGEESWVEEELEEYGDNVENEMGVAKFARPSRCKESENRDIFGEGYFELPSLSIYL